MALQPLTPKPRARRANRAKDNMLFNLDEITPPAPPEKTKKQDVAKSGATKDKNRQESMLCRAETALAEALPKIERGTTTHYLTAGAWALHDLVRHVARQTGPAHLVGFTWSITEPAVRQLVKMRNDGALLSMSMIIDTAMSKWSRAACEFARANSLEFRTTPIHAKGFLLTNDDWAISVISSANFSNNPRIEAGVITDDPEIYKFHRAWIDPTIRKADIFRGQPELLPQEPTATTRTIAVYMRTPGHGPHPLCCSGSLKTPFIDIDSFFIRNGVYEYNNDGLELALEWARSEVLEAAATQAPAISVAGITEKTIDAIQKIAQRYNYKIEKYEARK